jgi:hypothetical protein
LVKQVLLGLGWLGLAAALWGQTPEPEVTVRLREVSRYVGQPFGVYVQVPGVSSTPAEPRFQTSSDVALRLSGSSAATQDGIKRTVFTYEAVPQRSGELTLPGGELLWMGKRLSIPATPVTVGEPSPTDAMRLEIGFSKAECYVGEPVVVTVTWTSTLSFNGIKAVHFRLPLIGSPDVKIYPPFPDIDPKEPGAIGLPVSEERILAKFSDAQLNGQSAVKIVFQRVVVPKASGSVTVPAAVLLCSYAEPRDAKFKGARYPSYFNNEFFEEDLTGSFTRYVVRSAPVILPVRPLPEEGRPAEFSGIVGRFRLETAVPTDRVGAGQPIDLTVRASHAAFPALLDLPGVLRGGPLAKPFHWPDQGGLPVLEAQSATWTLPVRPRHDQVAAVPALAVSYFDPETGKYGEARSEPIPLIVTPVEAVSVTEAQFADGTRLRSEIRPEPGGIFHNVIGAALLRDVPPGGWTWRLAAWVMLFGGPPLLWLGLCRLTREQRLTQRDPEAARRELAFQRFRQSLRQIPDRQVSGALRQYFIDRFGLHVDSGDRGELRRLAERLGISGETVAALEGWLGRVEWAVFAPERADDDHPETAREDLAGLVQEFERRVYAKRTWWVAALFALGLATAAGADSSEAEALFHRANEASAVDPAQAAQFYRLAAELYEALLRQGGVHRGLVYYNLGNCYFLAGDTGRAVLSYRRAEPWLRGDPRWQQALAHVRNERPDTFPLSLATPGWRRVFFWHYAWSDQMRWQVIGLCWAVGWGLAGLRLFRKPRWLPRVATGLGLTTALLLGSNWLHAAAIHRDDAVILAREVVARKGDAAIYEPAFSAPLHAGAEVTILERRASWWRIQVEDGNEGWIPASAAEAIR